MLLDELNEPQKEAVTTIDGPLQIIAGAGSGKTSVLTYRVAYLIEQGVNPWNIIALTFTNKAAREIQHRISQLVNPDSAGSIWVGTFHSIFARILRIEAQAIGYGNNFTIYDTDDALRALKQAKNEAAVRKDVKEQLLAAAISAAKNKLIFPNQYVFRASTAFEKIIAECYKAYQKILHKNNAMDFDDILLNMLEVLQLPEVLNKYQNKFHYILIDEYQDTNKVQHVIVNLLAKRRQNICVVGDDAQSIYKWRGAEISNILNFSKDYPQCKMIKLEQNYRSTKNILAVADSIIKNNKNQLQKHLWTNNQDGPKVKLSKFDTDRDEANLIISHINREILKGNQLCHFAILYRTNAQSLPFEKACRAFNIPYILIGGVSFFKRKEVKDVLAYLYLLVNPNDNISTLRVINEPPRGIGKTTIAALEDFAKNNNLSIFESLNKITREHARNQNTFIRIHQFYDLITKHTELNNKQEDPQHFRDYIESTGILDYYKEIDDKESQDRIANITQLMTDLMDFLAPNKNSTLQDYLEQISLVNDFDAKDLTENRLTLMTLHAAKGLEYDRIFIVGAEENILPVSSAKGEEDSVEEERRLFYVGITRAKKELSISYAAQRLKFGDRQANAPSRFLFEIDKELFEEHTGNTFLNDNRQNFNDIFATPSNPALKPKRAYPVFDDIPCQEDYGQNTLKVGDIVRHNNFGRGRITAMDGIGDNTKIVVYFQEVGRKQLMAKFANLEKVDDFD